MFQTTNQFYNGFNSTMDSIRPYAIENFDEIRRCFDIEKVVDMKNNSNVGGKADVSISTMFILWPAKMYENAAFFIFMVVASPSLLHPNVLFQTPLGKSPRSHEMRIPNTPMG